MTTEARTPRQKQRDYATSQPRPASRLTGRRAPSLLQPPEEGRDARVDVLVRLFVLGVLQIPPSGGPSVVPVISRISIQQHYLRGRRSVHVGIRLVFVLGRERLALERLDDLLDLVRGFILRQEPVSKRMAVKGGGNLPWKGRARGARRGRQRP